VDCFQRSNVHTTCPFQPGVRGHEVPNEPDSSGEWWFESGFFHSPLLGAFLTLLEPFVPKNAAPISCWYNLCRVANRSVSVPRSFWIARDGICFLRFSNWPGRRLSLKILKRTARCNNGRRSDRFMWRVPRRFYDLSRALIGFGARNRKIISIRTICARTT